MKTKRVYVVCEGQTEEAFIKTVLGPHFAGKNVFLHACLIGKPGHKGGNVNYQRVKTDACLLLKQEDAILCTTMLDFFGLDSEFPGMGEYQKKKSSGAQVSTKEKARIIEDALKEKICSEKGIDRY